MKKLTFEELETVNGGDAAAADAYLHELHRKYGGKSILAVLARATDRFIVGISSFKNTWILHPGFLYGENTGELKNKAFLGFRGRSEEENCKIAIETELWDRYICMIVPKES